MNILGFLAFLNVSLVLGSLNPSGCGKRPLQKISNKIVGGNVALKGDWVICFFELLDLPKYSVMSQIFRACSIISRVGKLVGSWMRKILKRFKMFFYHEIKRYHFSMAIGIYVVVCI
jgi:hypothetical protein